MIFVSETEHKIQYDIDFVVERTLSLQGLAESQLPQTEDAFIVVKTEPKEEPIEPKLEVEAPIVKPDILKTSQTNFAARKTRTLQLGRILRV